MRSSCVCVSMKPGDERLAREVVLRARRSRPAIVPAGPTRAIRVAGDRELAVEGRGSGAVDDQGVAENVVVGGLFADFAHRLRLAPCMRARDL